MKEKGFKKTYCLACLAKINGGRLVCSNCYQEYLREASKQILSPEPKVVLLREWILFKAQRKLEEIELLFAKKKEALKNLQAQVREEAFTQLKLQLNNRLVPKNIFCKALQEKKMELWKQKGGARLFKQVKILESKFRFLQKRLQSFKEGRLSSKRRDLQNSEQDTQNKEEV